MKDYMERFTFCSFGRLSAMVCRRPKEIQAIEVKSSHIRAQKVTLTPHVKLQRSLT